MSKTKEQIQVMLDFVTTEAVGMAIGIFENMEEFWDEHGYLSEKQIATLERYFNKYKSGEEDDND